MQKYLIQVCCLTGDRIRAAEKEKKTKLRWTLSCALWRGTARDCKANFHTERPAGKPRGRDHPGPNSLDREGRGRENNGPGRSE